MEGTFFIILDIIVLTAFIVIGIVLYMTFDFFTTKKNMAFVIAGMVALGMIASMVNIFYSFPDNTYRTTTSIMRT
ncbi:MAG: hypothetical protein QM535_15000 [Limnohabitans sp.]|nr:hypothetical protein [Limnohabitans sp.]